MLSPRVGPLEFSAKTACGLRVTSRSSLQVGTERRYERIDCLCGEYVATEQIDDGSGTFYFESLKLGCLTSR